MTDRIGGLLCPEEDWNQDDDGKDAHAGEGGLGGDGADDVRGLVDDVVVVHLALPRSAVLFVVPGAHQNDPGSRRCLAEGAPWHDGERGSGVSGRRGMPGKVQVPLRISGRRR